MIYVIGLKGYIGSGKTEVAKYLYSQKHYHIMSFASPLKMMLKVIGLTDAEVYGKLKFEPCAKLGGRTPRYAMQMLGTEWGRYLIDPDLWVKSMSQNFVTCCESGIKRFVIDDVRFRNEASWLRGLNQTLGIGAPHFTPETQKAIIIGLTRKGDEGSHTSEVEQLSIEPDYTIFNNGTLDELYASVDNIVSEVVT